MTDLNGWVDAVVAATESCGSARATLAVVAEPGSGAIATTDAEVDFVHRMGRLRRVFASDNSVREVVTVDAHWYERDSGGDWRRSEMEAPDSYGLPPVVSEGFGLFALVRHAEHLVRRGQTYDIAWRRRAPLRGELLPVQACFGMLPAVGWLVGTPRARVTLDEGGRLQSMTYAVTRRGPRGVSHRLEMREFGASVSIEAPQAS
jgi:hypothetical protein